MKIFPALCCCLFFCLFFCFFVCLFFCLFVCLFVCLFFSLFVCFFFVQNHHVRKPIACFLMRLDWFTLGVCRPCLLEQCEKINTWGSRFDWSMPGTISARRFSLWKLHGKAMAGFNWCIERYATPGFFSTAEGLELFCLSEGLQDLCNSLHHDLQWGRTKTRKPTSPCCSWSLHQWRCGLQDVNRVPKPGWLSRGIVPKMGIYSMNFEGIFPPCVSLRCKDTTTCGSSEVGTSTAKLWH